MCYSTPRLLVAVRDGLRQVEGELAVAGIQNHLWDIFVGLVQGLAPAIERTRIRDGAPTFMLLIYSCRQFL